MHASKSPFTTKMKSVAAISLLALAVASPVALTTRENTGNFVSPPGLNLTYSSPYNRYVDWKALLMLTIALFPMSLSWLLEVPLLVRALLLQARAFTMPVPSVSER